MIGDSLSMENLLSIFQAMDRIKPIDQSECYKNYFDEIVMRIKWAHEDKKYIEDQLKKIKK